MLTIIGHTAEQVKDPFGILSGIRYECNLNIEVPEDDELYLENGVYVRVIFRADGDQSSIVKYDLHERFTDRYLDIDLEDEELALVEQYCREQLLKEAAGE
ncbi:DUF6509 family protein [Paenibacillus sp. 1001270B_150601_E10]|uniref:DUF6509 family protein n=1 Tax=Paenibacillus sp. 1001270B_150601_E10 TaxID=2787079 RepID=UPI00189C5C43|nr:DUF6509 family protein [Paenibacillus sp. 1001270B_150601_E10]